MLCHFAFRRVTRFHDRLFLFMTRGVAVSLPEWWCLLVTAELPVRVIWPEPDSNRAVSLLDSLQGWYSEAKLRRGEVLAHEHAREAGIA
jgi:hypothetical protein